MPPPIRIYFHGTGGTTPFNLRKMPCITLKYESYVIQFDFGEYCQYSLIKSGIHPFRNELYILITHFHADHVGGLPTFLHTFKIVNNRKEITIIGPVGLRVFIHTILNLFGIDDIIGMLRLIEIEPKENVAEKVIETKKFEIYVFKTLHNVPSIGFIFKEKNYKKFDVKKAEILGIPPGTIRGKLMRGLPIILNGKEIKPEDVVMILPGRKIVYTGDTKVIASIRNIIQDADLLIHEATYLKSTHSKHAEERYHATVEDVCKLAIQAKVKRLALVHVSPRYSDILDMVQKTAKEIIDEKLELIIPSDGDTIEI
ncbi:MAG: MBL fold metallo-hydrolase [Candidatus Njordarchaeota archaeon]